MSAHVTEVATESPSGPKCPGPGDNGGKALSKKRKVVDFLSLSEVVDALKEGPQIFDELCSYLSDDELAEEFRAEYSVDDPFAGPLFWLH